MFVVGFLTLTCFIGIANILIIFNFSYYCCFIGMVMIIFLLKEGKEE